MGKTELIQHVFHNKQFQKDYYCLYFDAYACGNIQEFTYALTNCIFNNVNYRRLIFGTRSKVKEKSQ